MIFKAQIWHLDKIFKIWTQNILKFFWAPIVALTRDVCPMWACKESRIFGTTDHPMRIIFNTLYTLTLNFSKTWLLNENSNTTVQNIHKQLQNAKGTSTFTSVKNSVCSLELNQQFETTSKLIRIENIMEHRLHNDFKFTITYALSLMSPHKFIIQKTNIIRIIINLNTWKGTNNRYLFFLAANIQLISSVHFHIERK